MKKKFRKLLFLSPVVVGGVLPLTTISATTNNEDKQLLKLNLDDYYYNNIGAFFQSPTLQFPLNTQQFENNQDSIRSSNTILNEVLFRGYENIEYIRLTSIVNNPETKQITLTFDLKDEYKDRYYLETNTFTFTDKRHSKGVYTKLMSFPFISFNIGTLNQNIILQQQSNEEIKQLTSKVLQELFTFYNILPKYQNLFGFKYITYGDKIERYYRRELLDIDTEDVRAEKIAHNEKLDKWYKENNYDIEQIYKVEFTFGETHRSILELIFERDLHNPFIEPFTKTIHHNETPIYNTDFLTITEENLKNYIYDNYFLLNNSYYGNKYYVSYFDFINLSTGNKFDTVEHIFKDRELQNRYWLNTYITTPENKELNAENFPYGTEIELTFHGEIHPFGSYDYVEITDTNYTYTYNNPLIALNSEKTQTTKHYTKTFKIISPFTKDTPNITRLSNGNYVLTLNSNENKEPKTTTVIKTNSNNTTLPITITLSVIGSLLILLGILILIKRKKDKEEQDLKHSK